MQRTDFSLVRLYSQRLAYLTQQLCEAQQYSGRVGSNDEPWGAKFQQMAAIEYERQLPRRYLATRSRAFRACQAHMEQFDAVPEDLIRHWRIVRVYLTNLAEALENRLQLPSSSERGAVEGEAPTTPAVVHFEQLAPLVSPKGLAVQLSAAKQVAHYCLRQRFGGLSEQEIQWIVSLSQDKSVADIAAESAYSERSMHRRLQELWSKMGVTGKTEAIIVAASVGWLSRPSIPVSLLPGFAPTSVD